MTLNLPSPHNVSVDVTNRKHVLLIRLAFELIFVGTGLDLSGPAFSAELKESRTNEIGYPTVAGALAALRQRPGVQISEQGGWTIVNDAASATVWSFTPLGHPAHPSAVKRSVVSRNGSTYIDMKVLCEASKAVCDKLVTDFQQLNQRTAASVQGQRSGTSGTSPDSTHAPAAAAAASEQINVTSDSAPGWVPSAEQRTQVPEATREFLDALDTGQYQKAYGLMGEGQRALESFDRFSKRIGEFNATAGAAKQRRIVKITWTKDPAKAPAPGVYAAVDLASRFDKVDRHCGYIVLYQSNPSTPFLVVHQEDNYITNEHAQKIATTQSPQALDDLWERLSKNCPNYSGATSGKE